MAVLSTYQLDLFSQLLRRDVQIRYRGAVFGFAVIIFNDLLMLGLYVLVFGFVFRGRYGVLPKESGLDYTLGMFVGLALFNYTAECLTRAPGLIHENPNYVKKVVFPLELIPLSVNCATLLRFCLSTVPILILFSLLTGRLSFGSLWLVPIIIPLFFFNLGILWCVSAFGVFIKDVQLLIGPINQVIMFGSAVFYSLSNLPQPFGQLLAWNPLAQLFQMARVAMLSGSAPNLAVLGAIVLLSLLFSRICFLLFKSLKPAFADVL
jgi:lipopolysaccharide transport system permease protein